MNIIKPRISLPLPSLWGHLYKCNELSNCLHLTGDPLGILPKVVRYARTQRDDIKEKAPYCLEIRVNEMFTGLEPIRNEDGSPVNNWYKGNHATFEDGTKKRNALLVNYSPTGNDLKLYYARDWFPEFGFDDDLAIRMISFIKKTRPIEVGAYKLESLDR